MQKAIIIIPALNPNDRLIKLVEELRASDFRIIAIDDGSGAEYEEIFRLSEEKGCVVARHPENSGKGTALKTGIREAVKLYGSGNTYITADADGQHLPEDILKVAEEMERRPNALVLGTRDLGADNVPFRSRLGNRFSSAFFRLTNGIACPDTQTGLRGIPATLENMALSEDGNRYEYEMNFLSDAARTVPLRFIPIQTVYLGGNQESHFRPVVDSARVYGRFLRFACASLIGAAADYILFCIASLMIVLPQTEMIFAATAIARIGSGLVNYLLNRYFSFQSRKPMGSEILRYGILFFCQMGASAGLVALISLSVIESEQSYPEAPEPTEPVITENSYISDTISITISELDRYDTQVYVADVVLKAPSYLKAGLAKGAFGRNISDTTSVIAEESNAVFAVNGDYYGFRDRGFVMRNGYLYRETPQKGDGYEDLVNYEDGSLEVVNEVSSDASELAAAGAVQVFSFGPGLLQNGEITVNENSEVGQAMRSNPRTAIGEIEPLHYVFVVSDGRTEESAGLTLFELAGVMRDLNCHTAYNLDGGGSSTMWFMGKVVNHPTSGRRDGERRISDIVYIGE